MSRLSDLIEFYRILARLEERLGGKRTLAECHGRMAWPRRGVYFFFEPGEHRKESGSGLRVVRVGTHALTANSNSTLWSRLSQHRGSLRHGGGNHRGSIFRLLVGTAIMSREDSLTVESWGIKSDAGGAARQLGLTRDEIDEHERGLEQAVSNAIGAMPIIWLAVNDPPGPQSARGIIERNAIALLSNYGRPPLDTPSPRWLGQQCCRERVRQSGLWNNNYVDEEHSPGFLAQLADLAIEAEGR